MRFRLYGPIPNSRIFLESRFLHRILEFQKDQISKSGSKSGFCKPRSKPWFRNLDQIHSRFLESYFKYLFKLILFANILLAINFSYLSSAQWYPWLTFYCTNNQSLPQSHFLHNSKFIWSTFNMKKSWWKKNVIKRCISCCNYLPYSVTRLGKRKGFKLTT